MFGSSRSKSGGLVGQLVRGVLGNPMPWAILFGALSSALDLELIGPVGKTVGLLADAASPVALFTIGAVLARSQIRVKESGHPPILWRDFLPVALMKLVLHPVLVLLVNSSSTQSRSPARNRPGADVARPASSCANFWNNDSFHAETFS